MKLKICVEMVPDSPKKDLPAQAPARDVPSPSYLKIKLGIWYLE